MMILKFIIFDDANTNSVIKILFEFVKFCFKNYTWILFVCYLMAYQPS